MKLAVFSDLHCECLAFLPEAVALAADVVVLAGDIHNGEAALIEARAMFPQQPIVQVAGNHEFYDGQWQDLLPRLRETARRLDIHLLENDAVVLDGVRFLGATLWTDFELYARPGRPRLLSAAEAKERMLTRMADFRAIQWEDRLLEPDDTVVLHRQSRQWLAAELGRRHDGSTVVVTHHLPSIASVAPEYARASTNTAFASDLDDLFGTMDLWIHGHTHHSFDYRCGRTRVLANPRGYPLTHGGMENPAFDPGRVIEV